MILTLQNQLSPLDQFRFCRVERAHLVLQIHIKIRMKIHWSQAFLKSTLKITYKNPSFYSVAQMILIIDNLTSANIFRVEKPYSPIQVTVKIWNVCALQKIFGESSLESCRRRSFSYSF
jgi:hypothetical protein